MIAFTGPGAAPVGCHDDPTSFAILLMVVDPDMVNVPPAYNTLFDPYKHLTVLLNPAPTGPQELPFHLAILNAELPLAVVKSPPAYKLELKTIREVTLLSKLPAATQLVPFHFAT